MTEEQAFRDALRRADAVEIPVPPIDPGELTWTRRSRVPWRGVLAAAAALIVVAGVGVGFMLNGRGIPASPAGPPEPVGATVEVDIFSGRENPVIDLPASATDELYALLAARMDDPPHPHPHASFEPGLGFRGLVVTPADSENRSRLRLLPGLVHVGSDDDFKLVDDDDQLMFQLVLNAIRDSLPEEVLTAIDEAAHAPVASGTTVNVNIYSGRENPPAVDLDPNVADELYAVLADQAESLKEIDPSEGQFGMPAFLVTSEQADRPELWVMREVVYVLDSDDRLHELLDPDGLFFHNIFDAIRDSLPDEVVKLIDELDAQPTEPVEPGIPSDGPEQVGDLGTWVLLDPGQVTSASTEITIGVTRLDCSSGVTGEVLEPVVEYTDSHVIIRADVAVIDHNLPQTCQGNDEVPVAVKLSEPIGDRPLVDAACLAGDAVTTSFCAEGPVRWRP